MSKRARLPIIDADVHTNLPSPATVSQYIDPEWRSHFETYGLRRPNGIGYFATRPRAFSARSDSVPPSGAPPGSDLAFAVEQLLDGWEIDYGIINPIVQLVMGEEPGEYGAALTRALNDWTLAEWLEPEPRFFGSLCVSYEEGELAVREIERLGGHPRFAQVLFSIGTREPLGNRKYWPVYEAAVAHDLPVALHIGAIGGNPITAAGWPSSYFDFHSGFPATAQAHVISLVCEGVFERFPDLRIVMTEAGFGWVAPLMWRLDRSWRQLRSEVPKLQRQPSEYVREHFWFTTQPIEEPEHDRYLPQLLDQMDMDDRLMFASDYPHWDFDAPDAAIPRSIGEERRRKIMAENARALYGRVRAAAEVPA